jgi:hypothetical protein
MRDSHSFGPWKPCLLASLGGEISSALAVLREFTTEDDVVTVRTEDFRHHGDVELFSRINQRIGSLLRSVEAWHLPMT